MEKLEQIQNFLTLLPKTQDEEESNGNGNKNHKKNDHKSQKANNKNKNQTKYSLNDLNHKVKEKINSFNRNKGGSKRKQRNKSKNHK